MLHHRHTVRLQKLDYSLPNRFFITLCALRHGVYFQKYPQLKKIISGNLFSLSKYFPNISVDKNVIMPNHIHLIIRIKSQVKNITLGKIINVFKGKTINQWLKIIKQNNLNIIACIWQRNYYEHRIRNDEEYYKYSKYIQLNPKNWSKDKYNPVNFKHKL